MPSIQQDAVPVLQGTLRGPFRQMIGPGAQRRDRLDQLAESPQGYSWGHVHAGHLSARRTDQAVRLMLGQYGMEGRDLVHLMPLCLGVFSPQHVLTVLTALRVEGGRLRPPPPAASTPFPSLRGQAVHPSYTLWVSAVGVGPKLRVLHSTVSVRTSARSAAPAPAIPLPSPPSQPRASLGLKCILVPRGAYAPISLVVRRFGCP